MESQIISIIVIKTTFYHPKSKPRPSNIEDRAGKAVEMKRKLPPAWTRGYHHRHCDYGVMITTCAIFPPDEFTKLHDVRLHITVVFPQPLNVEHRARDRFSLLVTLGITITTLVSQLLHRARDRARGRFWLLVTPNCGIPITPHRARGRFWLLVTPNCGIPITPHRARDRFWLLVTTNCNIPTTPHRARDRFWLLVTTNCDIPTTPHRARDRFWLLVTTNCGIPTTPHRARDRFSLLVVTPGMWAILGT
ncbi:hypothetical protein J6590_018916 [Homalodisca vitripennis]|nr:hypothetical protein J6590_018916 [Homalodisca vitripennis]